MSVRPAIIFAALLAACLDSRSFPAAPAFPADACTPSDRLSLVLIAERLDSAAPAAFAASSCAALIDALPGYASTEDTVRLTLFRIPATLAEIDLPAGWTAGSSSGRKVSLAGHASTAEWPRWQSTLAPGAARFSAWSSDVPYSLALASFTIEPPAPEPSRCPEFDDRRIELSGGPTMMLQLDPETVLVSTAVEDSTVLVRTGGRVEEIPAPLGIANLTSAFVSGEETIWAVRAFSDVVKIARRGDSLALASEPPLPRPAITDGALILATAGSTVAATSTVPELYIFTSSATKRRGPDGEPRIVSERSTVERWTGTGWRRLWESTSLLGERGDLLWLGPGHVVAYARMPELVEIQDDFSSTFPLPEALTRATAMARLPAFGVLLAGDDASTASAIYSSPDLGGWEPVPLFIDETEPVGLGTVRSIAAYRDGFAFAGDSIGVWVRGAGVCSVFHTIDTWDSVAVLPGDEVLVYGGTIGSSAHVLLHRVPR